MILKTRNLITALLLPTSLCFSLYSQASSIYLGHSQSEQVSIIGERTVDLNPAGQSIYVSMDLNDEWSVSTDFTRLDDQANVDNLANLEFEIETFGVGVSYFQESWSLYYNYSTFDDEQVVNRNNDDNPISTDATDVKTHSFGGGYFWSLDENWQISLTGSVHISDWDQTIESNLPNDDRPPQSALDSGDSTLISVSANLARFIEVNESTAMTIGSFVSWNEAIDTSSEAVSRNGRNVSQVRNPDVRGQVNSQVATGSESYGQLSLYVSFDFFEDWVLDVDTSFDFGTDENTQSWSVNVGYMF